MAVVDDGLGDDGAAESVNFVDLLYLRLIECLYAYGCREEVPVVDHAPHLEILQSVVYVHLPLLKLIGNVIVEFKRGSEAYSLLSLKGHLEEVPLVYSLDEGKRRLEQLAPLNPLLLPSDLFQVVLMLLHFRVHPGVLPQELAQEINGAVDVYCADEGDELEIEQLCLEREQIWTVVEYLLHR